MGVDNNVNLKIPTIKIPKDSSNESDSKGKAGSSTDLAKSDHHYYLSAENDVKSKQAENVGSLLPTEAEKQAEELKKTIRDFEVLKKELAQDNKKATEAQKKRVEALAKEAIAIHSKIKATISGSNNPALKNLANQAQATASNISKLKDLLRTANQQIPNDPNKTVLNSRGQIPVVRPSQKGTGNSSPVDGTANSESSQEPTGTDGLFAQGAPEKAAPPKFEMTIPQTIDKFTGQALKVCARQTLDLLTKGAEVIENAKNISPVQKSIVQHASTTTNVAHLSGFAISMIFSFIDGAKEPSAPDKNEGKIAGSANTAMA